MKMKYSPLALALIGALSTPAMSFADNNENQRYLIKYKDNQHARMSSAVSSEGGKVKTRLDKHKMVSAELSPATLKKLRGRNDIEFIEIDPKRYLMAESTPYGITMVEANQVSDNLTGNMTVCITDTGYDLGHEDLPSSGVTGDANSTTGNWYEDGYGHGTHVAGTIAGIGNNGTGVVGVNPSGNLNIHAVKVFTNAGSWGYGSDMAVAIDQCTAAGANVISMSLGGSGSSSAEQAAFDDAAAAGILSIAAAGNDGNSSLSYPASYDSVMSVAAVDSNGNKASFSQYNSQVEIAAPGVGVMSTLPGNTYAAWDGTSMATPHVAGVAALVWSHYPSCNAAEIRQAINKSAEDKGAAGRDNNYGHGIVKAKAMYDMLANGCDVGPIDPPPPPPPPGELEKGVSVGNISASTGDDLMYSMVVPSGATDLSFNISGGSGDADLYVRFGAEPTSATYDCRPYAAGNNETCSFASPSAGTYYVMLSAYSSYSGVSLIGDYTDDGTPPPPPPADINLTMTQSIKGSTGKVKLYWDGATTGNVDIYRNGSLFKNTANDGYYQNRIRKATGKSYTYIVCDEDTDNCSSEVTASF
jgi:serine protease